MYMSVTLAPKLELPPDRPPIFVPAGIIKTEEESLRYNEADQLAIQVIGSVSERKNEPEDLGPDFHFDEESGSADNHVRLRNPGHEEVGEYATRIIDAAHDAGQLVFMAITSLKGEDPEQVLPRLAVWADAMGVDGVELNGSCPNEEDVLLCQDLEKTKSTCYAVREAVGDSVYLTIKMSRLGEMHVRHLKQAGLPVDAIVSMNALKMPPMINPATGEPYVKTNSGYVGRSGHAIKDMARSELYAWLRSTRDVATHFPVHDSEYDLWSVGGVDNGFEIYDRVRNIGALAAGGAQELRRSDNPVETIQGWGREYAEAIEASS